MSDTLIPTTTTTTTPAKFVVGSPYQARSACNYDTVWTFLVIARTAKFITLCDDRGEVSRVGVSIGYQGHEIALPLGRYSMAPCLSADRPAA